MKEKIKKNIWKYILLVIICALCFKACNLSKRYKTSDINEYETYLKEIVKKYDEMYYFMPKIESLGNYENLVVTRRTMNTYLFDTTESIGLFLTYNEEEYKKEKERINNEYYLLNNESELPEDYVIGYNDYKSETTEKTLHEELNLIKDYDANVNGYSLQIVYFDYKEYKNYKHFLDYTKNIRTIGFNDNENKICHLYHYDPEIDEVKNLDRLISKCTYFPE